MELVFGRAMKEYNTFLNIEKQANKLFAFYSKSHKRTNFLRDFLKYEDIRPFQLSKIFDVRWVSSHYAGTDLKQKVYYSNWKQFAGNE